MERNSTGALKFGLCAVAAALFVVVLALNRSSVTERESSSVEAPSVVSNDDTTAVLLMAPDEERDRPDPRASLSNQDSEDTESEVQLEAAKPGDESQVDLGEPYRDEIPEASFETEYARLSAEELRKELDWVEEKWEARKKESFNEMFEEGQFTALPLDANGVPIFGGSTDGRLYQSRTDPSIPGKILLIKLPFGRYSDVYDLGDRWAWLRRANRRAKAGS